MTTTTETIAAHAARLAESREHWHCPHVHNHPPTAISSNYPPTIKGCGLHGGVWSDGVRCTIDHRTAAERKEATLDALAVVWEYVDDLLVFKRSGARGVLQSMFDRIQRKEATE